MISNVRQANELTVEIIDEFKSSIPFQTVEHRPWRNVLTVCLGGIGDLVLTTPFLRELKRNHPTSCITLITTPGTLELAETLPFVDCVRPFDWKKNIGTLRARMSNAQNFVEGIMSEQHINAFDAAILPSWDIDLYGASFLIFFSRAAKRIGYSQHVKADKMRANKNFDLLFNVTLKDQSLRHESERGLQLLKHIGDFICNPAPELYPLPEDHSTVAQLLKERIDGDFKLIILGVSATAPHRIWDQKNFSELINRLNAWRSDLKFVIIGGQDASDKAAFIVENTPRGTVIDLTNQLTLRESAALCSRASIYIGNNTGTMHLASTAGMKCIALISMSKDGDDFHPDSAARTRPFGDGHVILQPEHALDDCIGYCRKPFAHCINQITVDEVFKEVKRIVE